MADDQTSSKTDDILPILHKIATENNFQTYDIQLTPITTGGANYTSVLYKANISGVGHDDLRLFVKAAVLGEQLRDQTNLEPFNNEIFIYTALMPAYRLLEDRHGVSDSHRLQYPKYYGSDPTRQHEVMVLEDLTCRGFVQHDRLKSVDWEYSAAAITQLSRLHALSFAHALENPKEFEKAVSQFSGKTFKDNEENKQFYNTSVKTALEAVREENKGLLKSFLDRHNIKELCNYYDTQRRPVLMHGDFRPSNMLHRDKKDGTVDLIPVDYQTLQYGSPLIDLIYFIFSATDGSARAQFYSELVEHYYSELGAALARLGLKVQDVYSKEDFLLELKEKLPFGLLHSSLLLPILLVAEEDAPKLDSDMNMASIANVATGDLHKKRLNEVVDDFIAWGILK